MPEIPSDIKEDAFPLSHAFLRDWSRDWINVSRYYALVENWKKSQTLIKQIREELAKGKLRGKVRTIATAGSLGRMEASDLSDADLIIVLPDSADPESEESSGVFDYVWSILEPLRVPKPKPSGVFSRACTREQLCGKTVGGADEKLSVFGKRLLLLLESQPVYSDSGYSKFIDEVIKRYSAAHVENDPRKEWAFLMNDLMRYFRALCVNYQWDFENDSKKWLLRNVKLRHSRLIMYSGLLFLLGEASKERQDKIAWLKDRLSLTPLERLAWVYYMNKDWSFHRVAGLYNVFLSKLNDPEVRKLHLMLEEGAEPTYNERYLKRQFADLKANSDALIAELLRFVFARRNQWSERFFEYLIF